MTNQCLSGRRGLSIGEAGISMKTKMRGSSNAKARQAPNWPPIDPNWHDGFRRGFAPGIANAATSLRVTN